MDKLLLNMIMWGAGLLIGFVIYRRWQPLLFTNWRGLPLALSTVLPSFIFFSYLQRQPEDIVNAGPVWLVALSLLIFSVWLLFAVLNFLSAKTDSKLLSGSGPTTLQKILLLMLLCGLAGETAVLVANRGVWPVAPDLLLDAASKAEAAGIRNNAYIFFKINSDSTPLGWLGQNIRLFKPFDRLTAIPAISAAEILTAVSYLLLGISQFIG